MPAQPNVIVIYADDLGWGDLGCYGSPDVRTPALDRLAAEGVRMTDWYANSPVCSPSRASLLTGLYPAHAGVESILAGTRRTPGLPPQRTLAEALRERGYATGIFGKWHLGAAAEYGPTHYGFDEHFGFRAGCVDYYSHIYYWGQHNPIHDLWENEDEVWANGRYLTTEIGRRAADFVDRHADRPFFCFVPFNAPHYPMHAPQEYVERYAHLPEDRRIMAAMITAMDDAIQVILDRVEAHGLEERTIVFFSSDNGPSRESRNWLDGEEVSYHGGSTGGLRGSKGSVFEGGIRVPAIVRWCGSLAPRVDDEPGAMMDLLPTVLHAVDGEEHVGDDLDGRSVLPRWRGERTEEVRPLCWTYDGQWAVREGDYKLVSSAREGMDGPPAVETALFDLAADPGERRDLASSRPDVVERLQRELDRFRRHHGDWVSVMPGAGR
ncbi:sulfatase-like hydrolase/transferase [Streptomyces sp. MS2A]|nr:sulfatase-like hydrolase/transferase [Streptomyces sp. MS2A]